MRLPLAKVVLSVLAAAVLLGTGSTSSALDDIIDAPMYRLPDLAGPQVEMVFPDRLKGLWLRALERPEAEMRMKAAASIALAHRRGMRGLDAAMPALLKALDRPAESVSVRTAIIEALIALDAQQAAARLLTHSETIGVELQVVVDPALARWHYLPAAAIWRERVKLSSASSRSLLLAIEGLGVIGDRDAVDRLCALAASADAAGPVRVEAARAVGRIASEGLETAAGSLAMDAKRSGIVGRLAAASMLRGHTSPAAVGILQRLARDAEPAVSVVALDRLLEIDPTLAVPMRDHLLANPDPDVRTRGLDVLFRVPSDNRILALAGRMADAHPRIRKTAREYLLTLAKEPASRSQVEAEARRVLDGKDWRGHEQAITLLALLDHCPAAPRFAALLTADRPEVFVTAAWGLRKLSVPATAQDVADYVRAEFDRHVKGKHLPGRQGVSTDTIDHQLSQLNQFLGQQKYAAADAVLRQFVPKRGLLNESRPAALWALGLLHERQPDPRLAAELEKRLNDVGSIPPEADEVRRMAAVALGRMKAVNALPSVRMYWTGTLGQSTVNNACGWAITQLTGEALPPRGIVRRPYTDWFLMPEPQRPLAK
jgi:hypothetical protein